MKPSERIKEKAMAVDFYETRCENDSRKVQAIIDFLDEQYEKGCWCVNAFGNCPNEDKKCNHYELKEHGFGGFIMCNVCKKSKMLVDIRNS
jgi:hypothetical protein